MSPRQNQRRRAPTRAAYLLPSLLTIGNMLLGFYALIVGVRGDFQRAALLVFAAAILDGLDGRFARSSGTDSDFGKEYDSLADLLTFGIVPALLAYFRGLDALGRIGWLLPFVYVVCTATRLARFNVQSAITDRRFFVGLPAPAAAGLLCSVLYVSDSEALGTASAWQTTLLGLLLASLAILGVLMLSTFRYYSFKELDPRRRWSYRIVLPILGIVLLVVYDPAAFFLAVSGTYAVSGPLLWLHSRMRSRSPSGGSEPESRSEMTDSTRASEQP
jgi:CDP-diacylglycerol--serine O-phosphatidyltransferase